MNRHIISMSIINDGVVWNTTRSHSLQTLTKQQYMDLQTAKKEALAKSKVDKKKSFYLNVDDDGEVTISTEFDPESTGMHFKGGAEVALPATEIVEKSKIKKQTAAADSVTQMEKSKSVKKSNKKTSGKKFPKKVGKNSILTIKEIIVLLNKGKHIFRQSLPDARGVITLKRAQAVVNQDNKVAVIITD